MSHKTRSGRPFKPSWCGDVLQTSPWAEPSDLLHTVLPPYMHTESLLKGRTVCSAWRGAFGSYVQNLQLVQPMSAGAARAMGRKATAAFSSISSLHVVLYHDEKEAELDLTGAEAAASRALERPAAAAALLRPFGKLQSLQLLHLSLRQGQCSCLSSLLPLVPQLRVLDLTGCYHLSSDLVVIADHLQQLRELVLHSSATTLSGRKVGSADRHRERPRNELTITRYRPQHLAALVRLPHLQLLECPLPTSSSPQERAECLSAIAQLTGLKGLHLFQGWRSHSPLLVAAVDCLSALTALTHLKSSAGQSPEVHQETLGRHWQVAFAGMQQLQRLEFAEAVISDPLLEAIGGLPQLQHLVLNMQTKGHSAQSSAAGAQAISHVPHIELVWKKGFSCKHNQQLVQLPGIKRLYWEWASMHTIDPNAVELSGWSQEKCICISCFWHRWQLQHGNAAA